MSRIRPRVITAGDAEMRVPYAAPTRGGGEATMPSAAPVATSGEDGYVSKLVKYIPAEIIALQQLFNGIAPAPEAASDLTNRMVVFGGLSLGLLVLTPFWFAATTRDKGEPVAWSQVVLSTLAFAIWLFAVGSPAISLLRSWGLPETGLTVSDWSILFAVFVAVTPMLEKIVSRQ